MQVKSPFHLTLVFSIPFILVIAILLSVLIVWEKKNITSEQMTELRETARALFGQINLSRIWNAGHGGVYVEVSDKVQPNPYLSDPEREIVSISGRIYTKINPAYMTRQMAEISRTKLGYTFRPVSLNPLNPANQPDAWEAESLRDFEKGVAEKITIVSSEGERYFRFIAPLKIEKPCLNCHDIGDNRVGDTRGGISITIPMRQSDILHGARVKNHFLAFAGIGAITVVFVTLAGWFVSKRITRDVEREIEHKRLKAIVEMAGAAAHEIRQPLTVIIGLSEMLPDKIARNESVAAEMEIIIQQCKRINEIITKMLGMTEYRTRKYGADMEIIDLGVETKKYD